jgi:hypothetical protein
MSKIIEISDELYSQIKVQIDTDGGKEINNYEDMVGNKYYFRTVTYHSVGEVKKIVGRFAHLKNASWIPDSGRFMNAIKEGTLNEIEPVGEAFINLDALVDFFPWTHKLPSSQK